MGVMESLVVPYDGWTVDDLPDVGVRCETGGTPGRRQCATTASTRSC